MNTQIYLRTFITLSFLLLLAACGESRVGGGETDLGSTNAPTSTKPVAVCNEAGNGSVSYRTITQYTSGAVDPNYMNLFMISAPSSFESGTTGIRFWKGQANSDTTIGYASAPLTFGIYDRQGGGYLPGTYSELNWNTLKTAISGVTTPSAFFARVSFLLILQDPMSQYQTLSVASYNLSSGVNVEDVASLLPTFHANPSDYAIKSNGAAREAILKHLHPLKSLTSGFESAAAALCN